MSRKTKIIYEAGDLGFSLTSTIIVAFFLLFLTDVIHSVFIAAIPIFLIFAVMIGLNWVAERFWCRYLCPLGGMLGIVSRGAILRREVSEACTDCGL